MDERKIIRTYSNAWNVEKRLYSIGDLKLPRALAFDTMGFALLGFVLALLISKIPIIGSLSPSILYGGLVIGFPILMKKARIHSKSPARFVLDYCAFIVQPKSMVRFQAVEEQRPIRFTNVRHG